MWELSDFWCCNRFVGFFVVVDVIFDFWEEVYSF